MTRIYSWREGIWAVIIACGWLWLHGPGNLEGRFYPAAAPMTLDRAAQGEQESSTVFWGASFRLRMECNYRDIKWFMGSRGSRNVPLVVDVGPPEVRPDGEFRFGPWTVNVSPDYFESFTYADVFHRCSIFGIQLPWLTRSRFWN